MAFYQHKTPDNIGNLGVIRFATAAINPDLETLEIDWQPVDDTTVPFDDFVIGGEDTGFPHEVIIVPFDGEPEPFVISVPASEVGLSESIAPSTIMGYCEVYPHKTASGVTWEKICKEVS
jgi:hypothetical protein